MLEGAADRRSSPSGRWPTPPQVQLVLQDPFASMNPVHRMRHNLVRPLIIHGASKQDAPAHGRGGASPRVARAARVGSSTATHTSSRADSSSASRLLARCASNPQVLLADEPISMLDVSVRLGVLNLLRGLCDDEQLAILYITHDIASARYIADDDHRDVRRAGRRTLARHRARRRTDAPLHPTADRVGPRPRGPDAGRAPDGRARRRPGSPRRAVDSARAVRTSWTVCRAEEPPTFVVGEDHTSRCWLYADHRGRSRSGVADAPGEGGDRDDMTHFE